jgi:hypothetical protein
MFSFSMYCISFSANSNASMFFLIALIVLGPMPGILDSFAAEDLKIASALPQYESNNLAVVSPIPFKLERAI